VEEWKESSVQPQISACSEQAEAVPRLLFEKESMALALRQQPA
jgi:hypothetical protein